MKEKKNCWSRWYCYDSNGIKIVKTFGIDVIPTQLNNCSVWMRGTGPHTPEAKYNITRGVQLACAGVPKSPEQKRKMSLASKGKPKSLEHRKNMSISHKRRLREKYDNEQSLSENT